MSPTLTFSCNLPTSRDARQVGSKIKFGSGFDEFEVVLGKAPFVIMKVAAPDVQAPSTKFNLNCDQDFPSLKRAKVTTASIKSAAPPTARAASVSAKTVTVTPAGITVAASVPPPVSKGKGILYEENPVLAIGPPPSVFEIGSSSKFGRLTRTQRRNRNRKILKAKRTEALKTVSSKEIPEQDEVELSETAPLLRGSRFHLLSAALEEESAHRIAAAASSPPRRHGEKRKRQEPFAQTRLVFERLARKECCSIAEIIRRMGCAISPRVRAEILRKDSSGAMPQKPRIPVKLRLGERSDTTATHVVTASTSQKPAEHRPIQFRLGPRIPLAATKREPQKINNNKRSLVAASEPRVRDCDLSRRAEVANETSSLRTLVPKEKLRKPNAAGLVPQHGSKGCLPAKDSKSDAPASSVPVVSKPVLIEDVQQQSPVDLKIIKGKSIEDRLKKLRAEITKLSKEQQGNISDEECDLSDHMDEDFAEILVVETRASASSRDAPLPTEENAEDELRRGIQQRDEFIIQMEKKMEEMMAVITALQNQPQSPRVAFEEANQPEIIHIADENREPTQNTMPEKDIKQMVEQQVREALAQSKGGALIPKGRPYPEEFDAVPYPKGFVPPSFKTFDGTGNPRQHVAHFRASCCNAGGSEALLFRQFVSSLSGVAFDWYAELPNGSIKTFTELENMFVKRFAGAQHHITIGDLVVERQKPTETLVEYILRWRNLSMKCEPQLQEQHAIEILLKSIHGPVAFLLKGFTIKTFEKLLSKAASLQEEAKQLGFLEKADKSKPVKTFEKRSGTVAAVDKGKQPMEIQVEQPQQEYQQYHRSQRQQETYRTDRGQGSYMTDRLSRVYSFKDEAVGKMFRSLIKKPEFRLPEPKKPDEVDKKDHPRYCPYHRLLGHTIEGCISFKEWLEKNFKNGSITIPEKYLREPEKGYINMISVDPSVPLDSYAAHAGQNTVRAKPSKKISNQIPTTSAQAVMPNSEPLSY